MFLRGITNDGGTLKKLLRLNECESCPCIRIWCETHKLRKSSRQVSEGLERWIKRLSPPIRIPVGWKIYGEESFRKKTFMLRKILLIVASGKSTRLGGYPKAFVPIGDKLVVENTAHLAKPVFDEIYIGVNEETYAVYKDKVTGCRMFPIVTGNGDAHSVLKCLKFLRAKEMNVTKVAVCWGDAYFADSSPLEQAVSCMESLPDTVHAAVLCSLDREPYAWFELNGTHVKKAHFAGQERRVACGVHDQSLFVLTLDPAIRYLKEYKQELGIGDEYCEGSPEMKLLYFFEWLYESGKYPPAECRMIPPGSVLSFNTEEEAEEIRLRLKEIHKRNSEEVC